MKKSLSVRNDTIADGAGMVEYILVLFLIALIAYLGVQQFGLAVRNRWLSANRKVQSLYLGEPGMDRIR